MERNVPTVPPPASPVRWMRFNVAQYHRMLDTGILADGDPVELLDGVLVLKDRSANGESPMTVGKRHAIVVNLLSLLNARLIGRMCYLQSQNPISVPPYDEPEPDGAVVRGEARDYRDRLPGPGDVSCVIEVADSSLHHDRTQKLEIYAAAGIGQYVIVNLVDDCLEVLEEPVTAERRYARATTLRSGDQLRLRLGGGDEGLVVPVPDLLP